MGLTNFLFAVLTAVTTVSLCTQPTLRASEKLSAIRMRDTIKHISVREAVSWSPSFVDQLLKVGHDESDAGKRSIKILEGLQLLHRGDAGSASNAFLQAIAISPNEASLHWLLARCYSNLGDQSAGLQSCKSALQIDPAFVPAILTTAALLLNESGPDAALKFIHENIGESNAELDTSYRYYITGLIYLREEKYEEAAENFELSLCGTSEYFVVNASQIWYHKALAEHRFGKINQALLSAKRAVANGGERNEDALLLACVLNQKQGRKLSAFEVAKVASQTFPKSVRSQTALLSSLMQLNQVNAAYEVAENILKLDPTNRIARKVHDQQKARGKNNAEVLSL